MGASKQMTAAFPDRRRRAFITGITGQDGSYLAELLLAKGYEVHGIKRRSSSFNTDRVDHLISDWHEHETRFFLHFADLSDATSLSKLLYRIAPDEIYHLGAQSHVRVSFDIPEYTGDITALGTTRLLDAIRESGIPTRFYNAASSEMFGQAYECPQTETTPFRPRSPYGCAKLYSYWMTVNAREGYGLYAVNGILFNHESPRRGEIFVSRKITRAVARILHDCRTNSTWATSMANAIGATRRNSSKASGGCCSRMNRKIFSSPPAKPIPCANSSSAPSPKSAWTGAVMWKWTRNITAPRKLTVWKATLPKPARNSAGLP